MIVERTALDALIGSIARQGYQVLGPTVHDGAIVYREVRSAADLPIGWGDEQEGGTYRLRRREDEAVFGYAVGPQSWKQFLHPPRLRLWRARRGQNGDGLEITEEPTDAPRYAFFGVRSCELHAIAIQDQVFLPGAHPDLSYAARREDALLVAVNCGEPSGTCFCTSMGTGPKASAGYDLALTEVLDAGGHRFVVEVGSDRGALVLGGVPHRAADAADAREAEQVTAYAIARMGREMPQVDLRALLYANYEHPRWDEVAERCLTCGNCTMVCPTCFCTSVEDTADLAGEEAERWRRWESCFSVQFSHVTGGEARLSPRSRYRQWMTHKLATWFDQFGTSGCVGCGRCITWCPVGIDITEEVSAILANPTDPNPTDPTPPNEAP
ncbi:MAG: 4Fe-4S dicluster domain-containing protein [Solirubrobacteraceae bacterium]